MCRYIVAGGMSGRRARNWPVVIRSVAAVVLLAGFARSGEEALRHQAQMIAGGLPGRSASRLQRFRALRDADQADQHLVLGAAWAVWHLPLFFITGTVQHEFARSAGADCCSASASSRWPH